MKREKDCRFCGSPFLMRASASVRRFRCAGFTGNAVCGGTGDEWSGCLCGSPFLVEAAASVRRFWCAGFMGSTACGGTGDEWSGRLCGSLFLVGALASVRQLLRRTRCAAVPGMNGAGASAAVLFWWCGGFGRCFSCTAQPVQADANTGSSIRKKAQNPVLFA